MHKQPCNTVVDTRHAALKITCDRLQSILRRKAFDVILNETTITAAQHLHILHLSKLTKLSRSNEVQRCRNVNIKLGRTSGPFFR